MWHTASWQHLCLERRKRLRQPREEPRVPRHQLHAFPPFLRLVDHTLPLIRALIQPRHDLVAALAEGGHVRLEIGTLPPQCQRLALLGRGRCDAWTRDTNKTHEKGEHLGPEVLHLAARDLTAVVVVDMICERRVQVGGRRELVQRRRHGGLEAFHFEGVTNRGLLDGRAVHDHGHRVKGLWEVTVHGEHGLKVQRTDALQLRNVEHKDKRRASFWELVKRSFDLRSGRLDLGLVVLQKSGQVVHNHSLARALAIGTDRWYNKAVLPFRRRPWCAFLCVVRDVVVESVDAHQRVSHERLANTGVTQEQDLDHALAVESKSITLQGGVEGCLGAVVRPHDGGLLRRPGVLFWLLCTDALGGGDEKQQKGQQTHRDNGDLGVLLHVFPPLFLFL
eukprot:PhM_4_TR2515/c0_g1_i1/m.95424